MRAIEYGTAADLHRTYNAGETILGVASIAGTMFKRGDGRLGAGFVRLVATPGTATITVRLGDVEADIHVPGNCPVVFYVAVEGDGPSTEVEGSPR